MLQVPCMQKSSRQEAGWRSCKKIEATAETAGRHEQHRCCLVGIMMAPSLQLLVIVSCCMFAGGLLGVGPCQLMLTLIMQYLHNLMTIMRVCGDFN